METSTLQTPSTLETPSNIVSLSNAIYYSEAIAQELCECIVLKKVDTFFN